jgi:predicted MPP superfamily phosphohydrolase
MLSPFVIIVCAVLIGDVAWWQWADRRARETRRPRLWRTLLALFTAAQLGYLLWFITFPDRGRHAHLWVPSSILAMIYLWHLLILPITLLILIPVQWSTLAVMRRRRRRLSQGEVQPEDFMPPTISRRQAMASAALIALPPLLTFTAAGRAMRQVQHFRVNRIELPLASLPRELDGMTIAQVSDLHLGRFTRAGMLPAIVEATNALRADLVVLTGDLIDLTLADLPAGIDFVRRLDPRGGLFIIEGNHDLIENPRGFETRVKDAGLPLLLDESAMATIRGQPVQILGMSWGRGDAWHVGAMARLNPQRRPDAFPILLAHHPHAFDPAAAVGIPLTLSGHTHGGQIMLTPRLGAGPAMFRYWSGLYRRNDSALFVSNGVGNWFPLRIGAPAEIVHLTLRSIPSPSGRGLG